MQHPQLKLLDVSLNKIAFKKGMIACDKAFKALKVAKEEAEVKGSR